MHKLIQYIFIILALTFSAQHSLAQEFIEEHFSGLKFRNIGPAFTSGRIADIAIDPRNSNIWYVAVGSGGVWKTVNAGTTWTPIFDKQTTYSIGCITIDSNNPGTIWVGSGENVGGRHVAFGDGIYVSHDEGKNWKNMGLSNSEHISKIIVHPGNPNVIWVASQGPLWSKGGDRGIYKSIDGGTTWKRTLGNTEWTGATDILIDPNNPNILYAATWDRHRTVAAYMGGGPGSGIHKSLDGGETWQKLTEGIPKSNLGKIGLALHPENADIIYAAIELDRTKGGVYMSTNAGASWVKQSDAVSGGTGPHYYQELYASPHQPGRLYLLSNYTLISDDHGKTFHQMNESTKHVDSHALVFKKDDPNYLLFGTDGGLYETYDLTKTWRFIRNLPVTQYYKVAVDDAEPFYNVYGGTQDNGSHGGPSRTTGEAGISNADWWITLGADGHQSATEPGNPDITYGEFQQGYLWRIDQTTGETVFIQPQPQAGDPYERFNWDAPILVSPHNPTRLYVASQRVWKSENRGDEWTPISKDLTRNQDRITLPILGKTQSWDNPWDVGAMSNYNSITSLAESPQQEGLLYAGTDDGIIQISEDGGQNWNKVELSGVKGLPPTPFVNDIRADLFDANVVYAALDNHKYGDYKPYLLVSTNKGSSWTLMNGDLPTKLLTWRLVQDHIDQNLLFAATEYGIYFTKNRGSNWIKLKGNLPTISFRDITIQRRENDLVAASFGRGFFILDDIDPLRSLTSTTLADEATVFDIKSAYRYKPKAARYAMGDEEYHAKNPEFGAIITYYLADKFKSYKELRTEREKELAKSNAAVPFPGWQALENETLMEGPEVIIQIKDNNQNVIKTITGSNEKGFNRINWDLSYADRRQVDLKAPAEQDEDSFSPSSFMVTPGAFTATLALRENGKIRTLADPKSFNVINLKEGALPAKPDAEINAFREKVIAAQQQLNATRNALKHNLELIDAMKRAADKAPNQTNEMFLNIAAIKKELQDINKILNGDPIKGEIGERSDPSPGNGINVGAMALSSSTYGPTANHIAAFQRGEQQLLEIKQQLSTLLNTKMTALKSALKAAGAPYIESEPLIGQ